VQSVALAVLAVGALALERSHLVDDERFLTDRESPITHTLPEARASFTFAIFGDRTGGPREGIAVLRDAVRDVNLFGPDLVMTVGDLVQGYNTTAEWLVEAAEYKDAMASLRMPWFPVAGNHDVYWSGDGRPSGEHEGNFEQHFGPLWYAFEHEGAWFIALFSDEGDPATGRKSFGRPECQRMSERQFAWLDATLTRIADARHVFVFLHHPRWHGGGYGDDWQRVHARLAAAGNVTAVFAGHVHRMGHDGVRDGVEYMTLGAVGAHLDVDAPDAGYLHEYHLVTVRDDGIDVVAVPVGAAIDPRTLEGPIVADMVKLEAALPGRVLARPRLTASGVEGELELALDNATGATMECAVALAGFDDTWIVTPEHAHVSVPPNGSATLAFAVVRPGPSDFTTAPVLEFDAALATERARYPLPTRSFPLPLDLADAPAPAPSELERVLALDGANDCVRVPSAAFALPDGPFTLECRIRARSFRARQGVIAKTESSEYGLFASDGAPSFSVHLGGRYTTVEAPAPLLEPGRWHHLAGVFDGEQVRLYVDGVLVGAAAARGTRTPNALPLVIGGDVDGEGRAGSHLDGALDDVRLSSVARYTGERFEPARHHTSDADTLLLYTFDAPTPWAHDASATRAHVALENGARVVTLR
jgi:hypothetical protein